MSVSLLRLQNGEIAIVYLQKFVESCGRINCMPKIRFSKDECKTWSDIVDCIPYSARGYYCVNNDRVIQLNNSIVIHTIITSCRIRDTINNIRPCFTFVFWKTDFWHTIYSATWFNKLLQIHYCNLTILQTQKRNTHQIIALFSATFEQNFIFFCPSFATIIRIASSLFLWWWQNLDKRR